MRPQQDMNVHRPGSLPSFSVITPSFNQARFIEQTITSVLAQNYSNFEHIIVDGGSSDGTVEILQKYPHLKWVSEPDHGQSEALNKGLRVAQGEIIAWINSDDYYQKDAFNKVAAFFQQNPEEKFVFGDCLFTYGGLKEDLYVKNKPLTFDDIIRYWDRWIPPTQPTVFFKSELLKEFGYFDESLHLAMDFDFWLRISQKYRLNYIPACLAVYRFHGDSKSALGNDWRHFYPEWHKVYSRYRQFSKRIGPAEKLLTLALPLPLNELTKPGDYLSRLQNVLRIIDDQVIKDLEVLIVTDVQNATGVLGVSNFSIDIVFEFAPELTTASFLKTIYTKSRGLVFHCPPVTNDLPVHWYIEAIDLLLDNDDLEFFENKGLTLSHPLLAENSIISTRKLVRIRSDNAETEQQVQVSVVIPTYNRKELLSAAIDSIASQTYRGNYELIIVDDGSTDGTGEMVREKRQRCSVPLTYVYQPNSGPATARNRGILHARGNLVAFTDSDCTADRQWLERLVTRLTDPDVAGVGGVARSCREDVLSRYFDYTGLYNSRLLPDRPEVNYLLTLNACYRKKALLDIGMFSTDFRHPGGEDPELCIRLKKKGYRLAFEPEAIVNHNHKTSIDELYTTFYRYGLGKALIFKKHDIWGENRKIEELLGKDALTDYYSKCVSNGTGQDDATTFSMLHYIQEIALYSGYCQQMRDLQQAPQPSAAIPNKDAITGRVAPERRDAGDIFVSVVINNYNYAQYLRQCVTSVLDQTYRLLEVIVVDDGSTDESASIITELASTDSRVVPVIQKNGGQAAAINAGIAAAKGELVCLLDSDDYWFPHKVCTVVDAYRKNPGAALIQHNHYREEKGRLDKREIWPCVTVSGNLLHHYFLDNHTNFFSSTSGLCIPSRILSSVVPLDSEWRICADVTITRPLPLFGEVVTLPDVLGVYRVHASNGWMGSSSQRKTVINNCRYNIYTNNWLKKYGVPQRIDFARSPLFARSQESGCGAGLADVKQAIAANDFELATELSRILFAYSGLEIYRKVQMILAQRAEAADHTARARVVEDLMEYLGEGKVATEAASGIRSCPDAPPLLGPFFREHKAHVDETDVVGLLCSSLESGVMIDVGAHIGSALLPFLDSRWTIYAFEPDASNRRRLVEALEKHPNRAQVTLDTRCVSNRSDKGVPFYTSSQSTGISGLSAFHETHLEADRVDMVSLAEFFNDKPLPAVDFLKIDTEGHDFFVLQGFPWERCKPAVIECEFEDLKTIPLGYTFHDMSRFLLDKGYTVYVSEWHPILKYGVQHDWHRLTRYPCTLASPDGWGNLLAFRDPVDDQRIVAAFHDALDFRGADRFKLKSASRLFSEKQYRRALWLYLELHETHPSAMYAERAVTCAKNLGMTEIESVEQLIERFQATMHALFRSSIERIGTYHNIHAGKRCVIIGNGPSLNKMDLSFLEHEICFGLNRIFLLFDRWKFRPTYYASVNPLVLEQSSREILSIDAPKFISDSGIPFFPDPPADMMFIKSLPNWDFCPDPREGLCEGWTVTYFAMQLAYYMGFREVVLIGVDHQYVTQGDPNREVVSEGADQNHFHPDYFGKGFHWHLPDLEKSEGSYMLAKLAFEADGRRILDATVDGKLTIFPKVPYAEYFSRPYDSGQQFPVSPPTTKEVLNQANILIEMGRTGEAILHVERAVRYLPAEAALPFALGLMNECFVDRAASINHFESAVRLDPGNPTFLVKLATSYHQVCGKTAEAVNLLQMAIKADQKNVEAYQLLSEICLSNGQSDDAGYFGEIAKRLSNA